MSLACGERMVSNPWRRIAYHWVLRKDIFSAYVEGGPELFIGGRHLGAWEAVVFGEPHVESALAMLSSGG
jgi:hypothetical protein